MSFRETGRFYPIHGAEHPSVTSILQVIDKPALVHWAANEERACFQDALLAVLARKEKLTRGQILDAVIAASSGVKAMHRKNREALAIGTAAHALIEWHTRKMLGEKVGPEPADIPEKAVWAVEAWKDWCRSVDFTPIAVEQTVYCCESTCGFAGTFDWIAKVKGIVTLGDIKTAKGIYPEMLLQATAYRHAAAIRGLETEQAMILRLPKNPDDPAFEAMVVPEIPIADFHAAIRLWRWKRRMDGRPCEHCAV